MIAWPPPGSEAETTEVRMSPSTNQTIAGRGRRHIERARINGYLKATSAANPAMVRIHAFWCWKLRIPLIWFERKSPRSKYGQVHLDLFTTANVLTESGRRELETLRERFRISGRVVVSPFDAVWEGVLLRSMDEVCHTVFRIATRLGNYELRQRVEAPPAACKAAAAGNVLPWRMTA